ncbi:MAG: hypothetical protein TIS_03779 [Tissierella sp.]
MKWKDWIKKWNMESLKINAKFLEMEFKPSNSDKSAAWELYIELLTRSTTQLLLGNNGDEKAALESISKIFNTTREIIKKYGYECFEFSKIAIVILNQKIRPFTTRWHTESLSGAFDSDGKRMEFRKELRFVQEDLRTYTKMLAEMIGVEDLTDLECS